MPSTATLREGAIINKSARESFGQLRDRAEVIQVTVIFARQYRMQCVMKVVVPLRVKAVATCFTRRDDSRQVEIAFRDHQEIPPDRSFEIANLNANLLQEMNRRSIENRVDRIEPQTVDAIVAQPHQRIVAEKLPDLVAVPVVEVDGVAPRRAIAIGKVRAEFAEITALRTQVIVNDVQNDAEIMSVRRIDESLHPVGPAVRMMRRVEIDTVVAPSTRS